MTTAACLISRGKTDKWHMHTLLLPFTRIRMPGTLIPESPLPTGEAPFDWTLGAMEEWPQAAFPGMLRKLALPASLAGSKKAFKS